MELYLFARLHAHRGCQAALRQAIHDVRGPTRQELGCLEYNAFQSVRDKDEFYIHSRWRDKAAFEQHVAPPHPVTFATSVEALIDHPLAVSLTERLG